MNMPKSRDIQAKMPSPKVILNAFWLVTVKVLNSYIARKIKCYFMDRLKSVQVLPTPNSPESQTALHPQCKPARSCQPSHKANY